MSALLAGVALVLAGTGALGTMLGLQMAVHGYSAWLAGLVMSAYFLGIVLGTFAGQRTIARVGHIRAFAALAATLAAATLAHPFLMGAAPWAALRLLEGYCLAGLFMCTESWLNERSDNAVRGTVFAVYQIVVYLAQGAGQVVLNLPDASGGYLAYAIASILISLAVVPVALMRVAAPDPPALVRFGFRRLYAISPLGIAGAFSSGLLLGAIYGLGPYFARQVGLDLGGTTAFMGMVIVGGLALQWPIGRLSDRFDRRAVLCWLCFAIAVVGLAAAVLGGLGRPWLMALAPLLGGVTFTLYPLSVSHANDFIAPSDLVPMSGGLLVAYGVGAMAGPTGAAAVMAGFGPEGLFLFCSAVGVLTAAFGRWRMTVRAAVPNEEQGAFQPVPSTTPVAAGLDPRVPPVQPTFDFEADPQRS